MKRVFSIWVVLMIMICSCDSSKKVSKDNKTKASNTSIELNPNVQLLRIAYNLALADSLDIEYRPCNNSSYKQTQNKYSSFSNLPLVDKIRNGDEWNADIPTIALCFDESFDLLPNIDTDYFANHLGWYGKNLDSLSILLKEFKELTNYSGIDKINFQPFLDSLSIHRASAKLNDFFRQTKQPKLIIVFDPHNNVTNKAITFIKEDNDTRRFLLGYFCNHPDSTAHDLKLVWNDDYRRIVFHENAHLYTDELFKKYYDRELDSLINQPKFEKEYIDIDEIVVRAITAKILSIYYSEKVGDYEISNQPNMAKVVFNLLDGYLEDSTMTFEDIYSRIIEVLKKEYR